MPQSRDALKEELVHTFRKLYAQGTINLFEGNLSIRDGDVILMTPSQQNKETMTPDMIIEMDPEGRLLKENGCRPSSEFRMHLQIYRLRPDLHAVAHTHSTFATCFALTAQPLRGELAELHMFYGGEIPCCRYGTPGTDAVFADFDQYFKEEKKNVVLLANHGLVAAGKNLEEAFSRAEAVEKLAKITLLSRLLGPESPLPPGEAARLSR